MTLLNLPFVKLVIPFIFGIIAVIVFPHIGQFFMWGFLIFIPLIFLSFWLKKNLIQSQFFGLSVLATMLCFGATLTHHSNQINCKNNLKRAGLNGIYAIRVIETPQPKPKSNKIKAQLLFKIVKNSEPILVNEKVILYFSKRIKVPKAGDLLFVKCKFKTFEEPENPYQFNYKQYLKLQGIFYQTYIENSQFIISAKSNNNSISQTIAISCNHYLKQLFKKNIKDTVALGVTEALIFGYKDDLPKDLVDSYSKTGTLHVLAVSGLHVAIVFLMLAKSLWFLDKYHYGSWLKTIIVILCIWIYCLITGMSPSIIRAGIMISVLLIGKVLQRHTHIYNTIAVSAFVILLINPWWILNIGFQLSFLAVIGIVSLQNYVLPLFKPTHWFFTQVWNILVISFSAQLATFPLTLYYFNQFPNYFLLSNLLIIPLSSLILYSGIIMLMVSKFNILLLAFSWLTENLVKLTNYLVISIEKLPFSYSDGIKVDLNQLLLLYICVGLIIFWLVYKNRLGLFYFLVGFTAIISITIFDSIKLKQIKGIITFNIPGQNALLLTDGRKSILLSDTMENTKQMFYLRNWLIQHRLWPINHFISIEKIDSLKYSNAAMGLSIQKGIIFFRGSLLNLSSQNLNVKWVKKHYLLPKNFNWEKKYDGIICDTVFIGHDKSKRLQKKLKNFLSNYHNCVICETKFTYLNN